jgi:hypothetical protein
MIPTCLVLSFVFYIHFVFSIVPGADKNITAMGIRYPVLTAQTKDEKFAQSTDSVFPVAVFGGKDSHEAVEASLKPVVDDLLELEGSCMQVPNINWVSYFFFLLVVSGDLCILNSVQGLSTAVSMFGCLFCTIFMDVLGSLTDSIDNPWPARTLEDQNGRSTRCLNFFYFLFIDFLLSHQYHSYILILLF